MNKLTIRVGIFITLMVLGTFSCSKKETVSPTNTTSTTSSTANCSLSQVVMKELPYSIEKDTILMPGIYPVTAFITVSKNVKVTIMAGVTLLFDQKGGMNIDGSISAIGTTSCPILFTGKVKTPGYWTYVRVSSLNPDNKFENCTFEYGGTFNGSLTTAAEVQVSPFGNSGVSFKKCQFNSSISSGLSNPSSTNVIYAMDSCSFNGNKSYPLITTWEMGSKINQNCLFDNNNKNMILLVNDGQGLVGNASLYKQKIPFLTDFKAYIFSDQYAISLNPGVELIMNQNASFVLKNAANLNCNGTANNRITIRGLQSIGSYWDGIAFRDCTTDNQLNYVDFSNGNCYGGYGIVYVGKNSNISKVTVKNCSFNSADNYGFGFTYPYPVTNSSKYSIINGFTDTIDIKNSMLSNNAFGVDLKKGKIKID